MRLAGRPTRQTHGKRSSCLLVPGECTSCTFRRSILEIRGGLLMTLCISPPGTKHCSRISGEGAPECLMRLYKCFRMKGQGELYYCTMCQQSKATHHPTLFDDAISTSRSPTCTLCLVWRPVGNKQNRAGDDGTTSREGGGTAGFRNNSVAPQLVSLFSFASAAASAAAAAGTSITYGTRTGGAHTRGSRLVHPHPEEIEN